MVDEFAGDSIPFCINVMITRRFAIVGVFQIMDFSFYFFR
jgi:hypothetical protein